MAQNIAIIGAGVGGLTTALCLAKLGHRPQIFDKKTTLTHNSYGIQLSPNATRILQNIGILQTLLKHASIPTKITLKAARQNQNILSLKINQNTQTRQNAPYITLQRGHLINALTQKLLTLQPNALHIGKTLTPEQPHLQNGRLTLNQNETIDADIIIAADGVNSTARANLALAPHPPLSPHFGAWRGTLPTPHKNTLPDVSITIANQKHLVQTYINSAQTLNFVAIAPIATNAPPTLATALEAFHAFPTECKDLLKGAQNLSHWPLIAHLPLKQWAKGKAVLLGDAAHPMMPSLAQGAAMAIEDAYVLAQEIHQSPPQKAFARYFTRRFPRTARVQKASLANMKLFHRLGALAEYGLASPMRGGAHLIPAALIERRYDWLYGYECGHLPLEKEAL